MQAFKVYFKIIYKNLGQMSIYLIVFMLMAVAFSNWGGSQTSTAFMATKCKLAIINEDVGSPFSEGLISYLSQNASISDVKTDIQSLQDALFFRQVEYIVRIPKGFSQGFFKGDSNAQLEKTTVADSSAGVQADFLIERYLSLAHTYAKALPNVSQQQIVEHLDTDLLQKAEVVVSVNEGSVNNDEVGNCFIYLAYSIMAIMVLGVTSIMIVFNKNDLKRRNLASPMKLLNMNLQLVLGNLVLAFAAWALFCTLGFLLYGSKMLTASAILMMVNALVYTLVCLSISFLIGNLIKSKGAQSAIANVLSLGLCFISGVFVPQVMLGKAVLTLASFTPTYWYVKAVNDLQSIVVWSSANILPIVYSMLIQLGFAVACLAVALVFAKQKSIEGR